MFDRLKPGNFRSKQAFGFVAPDALSYCCVMATSERDLAAATLASVANSPTDLRAAALALAAERRFAEAIVAGSQYNRIHRDEEIERLLVVWRMSAFATREMIEPDPAWPPEFADPFPGQSGVPEIQATELTTDILAGAIRHHGALLVRGLIPAVTADKLAAGVDKALAGFAAWVDDKTLPSDQWFTAAPVRDFCQIGRYRPWILAGGGVWAADSPHMLFELTELLEKTGLIDMVTGYLAERPALSVGKTTLRRVAASLNNTDWHQDGSFLGKDVRSVNLWVALSPCGRDASGLDVVPRRIPYIVETGTQGATFEWAVGPGTVDVLAQETPVASPEFAAGDALLFDHLFLHRTSLPANRSKDRWAIECWMFSPSCYPADQGPLML